MAKKLKTLTVGKLKELLSNFPDDKKVAFAYPSGDHWRTSLVGEIRDADFDEVKHSGYHECFQLVDEDESGEEILILK